MYPSNFQKYYVQLPVGAPEINQKQEMATTGHQIILMMMYRQFFVANTENAIKILMWG